MRENQLKRKLQRGEAVLGPFMCYANASYVEIAGMAGFDFCIIDMEHGPLSTETAENMSRAAHNAGIDPIVRVRKNDMPQIQRGLDIGSGGVQVPQIETREDAEAVVFAAKYQPLGMRGVSWYTRAGDYTVNGTLHLPDALNQEQMIVIHIEGQKGLENLEDILTVPHIDAIFLGPYDLSQSFGIPGQVNDPRVVQGMQEAIGKIRDAGKAPGTFAGNAEAAKKWIAQGMQYIALGCDVGIFGDACKALVSEVKNG